MVNLFIFWLEGQDCQSNRACSAILSPTWICGSLWVPSQRAPRHRCGQPRYHDGTQAGFPTYTVTCVKDLGLKRCAIKPSSTDSLPPKPLKCCYSYLLGGPPPPGMMPGSRGDMRDSSSPPRSMLVRCRLDSGINMVAVTQSSPDNWD